MKSYLVLIIGMMLVTYIPRLVPLVVLSDKPINPMVEKFLKYIPYTALSALIVRGVMESKGELLVPTFVGLAASAICSWVKGSLILSVAVGIVTSLVVISLS